MANRHIPGQVRTAFDRYRERLGRRWWLPVVVTVGGLLHGIALASILDDIGPADKPPLLDSIIYEYIGWYLSTGGRLYVDVWEVKPPLVYEVTGVVAAITGDNMVVYHWLLVALTLVVSVLAAVVVGQLVVAMTDEPLAGLVAGLAPYTYPLFAWRGVIGFKPKYFVILLGFLTVFAAVTDRPLTSGVFGAASVGFWQLAVIFPAVAVGIVSQRGSRRALGRLVLGGGLLSVLVLAPVVAWGAVTEMVVEAMLTPLIVGEQSQPLDRMWLAIRMLVIPTAIGIIGLFGIGRSLVDDPSETWWVGLLTAWLLAQVLFLDLDSAPDLLPLFAVFALGVGLLVGRTDRPSGAVIALIAAMLVLSAISIWRGGSPTGYSWLPPVSPTPVDTSAVPSVPYSGRETKVLFWGAFPPETCRTFYGGLQSRYLIRVDQPFYSDCGAWEPAWAWIRANWLP